MNNRSHLPQSRTLDAIDNASCATPSSPLRKRPANRIRHQFTLVELLVVISIITILAALLYPALVHVRHRTKLTACQSNLKQIGLVAITYAGESRRRYPHRKVVQYPGWSTPYSLRSNSDSSVSDVALFQQLELEALHCPFTSAPDWSAVPSDTSVYASYSYYFGWRTRDPGCHLLVQTHTMAFGGKEFDLLVSDALHYRDRYSRIHVSSHPDLNPGLLSLTSRGSHWRNTSACARGPLDMNYCRTDGSVYQLRDLAQNDDRLTRLPYENSGSAQANPNSDNQLAPARDVTQ